MCRASAVDGDVRPDGFVLRQRLHHGHAVRVYAPVRAQVKAEGEAEALRDTYLFERATGQDAPRRLQRFGEAGGKAARTRLTEQGSRFFGEYLGVTLFVNPQDVAREKIQDREYRLRYMRRCDRGFPTRFGSARFCSMSTKIENPPCLRANIR